MSAEDHRKKSRRGKFRQQTVIDALIESKGIISAAARKLGCDRGTVARYIRKYPKVADAYEQVNETQMDIAEGRLLQLLGNAEHRDHFNALRFYLRTKARTRGYVERQEVAGVEDQPVKITLVPAKPK